jgi:AraC-like DNA-binding protein
LGLEVTSPPDDRVTPDGGWVGRLFFGPWWLVYAGLVGPTDEHRHHAVQLVAAPGTRGLLTTGAHPSPFIVPADHPHAIAGTGTGVVVFVDPEATSAATFVSRPPFGFSGADLPETMADATRVVTALAQLADRRPPDRHPAIARLLALLPDDPDAPLSVLAADVGLSPGRVTHLFRDQVGISLRAYRRWVRFLLAAEALRDGASLTGAAHHAGFADVAHLHRTFRHHFGLQPGPLLRTVEWVTV